MRKLLAILVCICSFNDPVYAASINVVTRSYPKTFVSSKRAHPKWRYP